jgi:hypothetical protein
MASGCFSSTAGSLRFSDTTSEASSKSSGYSSGATADAIGPGPSTLVVSGSALVLGAFGAITTTVYEGHVAARAQVKAEEFRKLHPVQLPPPGEPPPMPLPLPEAPAVPTPPPLPPLSEKELDSLILARAWLRANQLQLKQDLALGAGPAIEDLAGIAGIVAEHRAHFGLVLQRNRARFSASSELSLRETARVMSSVGELVLGDPVLRSDGELMLAAQ